MKIANIRLGFATNSSSSHSIIIIPPTLAPLVDDMSGSQGDYGWEEFVLASGPEKIAYLAALVGRSLRNHYGEDLAAAVMATWFEHTPWESNWYVDHNSFLYMPLDSKTGKLSYDFIRDFRHFLLRTDVAIIGGNDNADSFLDEYTLYQFDVDNLEFADQNIRASKEGDWWFIFNPLNGTKTQLSFCKNPDELVRSSVPQLIDLKITDFCDFGCAFCYQNSHENGAHADPWRVQQYLQHFSTLGVFEVALGGGEPTSHPEFCDILKLAHDYGIVPNFTTKCFPDTWDQALVQAVRDYVGGVAVSVTHADQIKPLRAAARELGLNRKISAQFVVGAHAAAALEKIMEVCAQEYVQLTLLGFKKAGRGKAFRKKPQRVTPELLSKKMRLSVDTAFLDQYHKQIEAAGIPKLLQVPGEGRFSMYVDAVQHLAGISSYHTESFVGCHPSVIEVVWKDLVST